MTETTILFIGCGNLGSALLERWVEQASFQQVVVVQPSLSKQSQFSQIDRVTFVNRVEAIAEDFKPDMVVLAFKPHHIGVLSDYRAYLHRSVVVSLLAGTSIEHLSRYCQQASGIVRVMPNLAMKVRESVNLMYAEDGLPVASCAHIEALFALTGEVLWVDHEHMIDLLAPIVSSGLAYFFLLAHCLEKAAISNGIEPKQAKQLLQKTLLGSARVAEQSPELTFEEMVERVASKKGVTEAALTILRPGMADLIDRALEVALKRTKQLTQ